MNKNFNWKDIDFGSISQSIQTGMQQGAEQVQTKSQIFNIGQQVKMNRDRFRNTMAERDSQIASSLNMIQSTEARRGVFGATQGIQEGVISQDDRQSRVIENEMLLTERNLLFAKELEEQNLKNQRRMANLSLATGLIDGISGALTSAATGAAKGG